MLSNAFNVMGGVTKTMEKQAHRCSFCYQQKPSLNRPTTHPLRTARSRSPAACSQHASTPIRLLPPLRASSQEPNPAWAPPSAGMRAQGEHCTSSTTNSIRDSDLNADQAACALASAPVAGGDKLPRDLAAALVQRAASAGDQPQYQQQQQGEFSTGDMHQQQQKHVRLSRYRRLVLVLEALEAARPTCEQAVLAEAGLVCGWAARHVISEASDPSECVELVIKAARAFCGDAKGPAVVQPDTNNSCSDGSSVHMGEVENAEGRAEVQPGANCNSSSDSSSAHMGMVVENASLVASARAAVAELAHVACCAATRSSSSMEQLSVPELTSLAHALEICNFKPIVQLQVEASVAQAAAAQVAAPAPASQSKQSGDLGVARESKLSTSSSSSTVPSSLSSSSSAAAALAAGQNEEEDPGVRRGSESSTLSFSSSVSSSSPAAAAAAAAAAVPGGAVIAAPTHLHSSRTSNSVQHQQHQSSEEARDDELSATTAFPQSDGGREDSASSAVSSSPGTRSIPDPEYKGHKSESPAQPGATSAAQPQFPNFDGQPIFDALLLGGRLRRCSDGDEVMAVLQLLAAAYLLPRESVLLALGERIQSVCAELLARHAAAFSFITSNSGTSPDDAAEQQQQQQQHLASALHEVCLGLFVFSALGHRPGPPVIHAAKAALGPHMCELAPADLMYAVWAFARVDDGNTPLSHSRAAGAVPEGEADSSLAGQGSDSAADSRDPTDAQVNTTLPQESAETASLSKIGSESVGEGAEISGKGVVDLQQQQQQQVQEWEGEPPLLPRSRLTKLSDIAAANTDNAAARTASELQSALQEVKQQGCSKVQNPANSGSSPTPSQHPTSATQLSTIPASPPELTPPIAQASSKIDLSAPPLWLLQAHNATSRLLASPEHTLAPHQLSFLLASFERIAAAAAVAAASTAQQLSPQSAPHMTLPATAATAAAAAAVSASGPLENGLSWNGARVPTWAPSPNLVDQMLEAFRAAMLTVDDPEMEGSVANTDAILMLASCARLGHIPGYAWTELAWSMALIRHQPSEDLVARLCSVAQQFLPDYTADNISTLVWSLAELGLESHSQEGSARGGMFGSGPLGTRVAGMEFLDVREGGPAASSSSDTEEQREGEAAEGDEADGQSSESLGRGTDSLFSISSGGSLKGEGNGGKGMEGSPVGQLLHAVCAEALPRMTEFAPRDMVSLLASLARLKHHPTLEWLSVYLQAIKRYLPFLDGQACASILSSLAALNARVTNSEWLQHFCRTTEPQLRSMDAPTLTSAAMGLARMGHSPNEAWGVKFVEAAEKASLPHRRLTGQQHVQLVCAMSELPGLLPSRSQMVVLSGTLSSVGGPDRVLQEAGGPVAMLRLAVALSKFASRGGHLPPAQWLNTSFTTALRLSVRGVSLPGADAMARALASMLAAQPDLHIKAPEIANLLSHLREFFLYSG